MVKLLHAADLHLDSAFSALPPEKAAQRRAEQRLVLERLTALSEGCAAVLLAGDLFDSARVYRDTLEALRAALAACRCPVFIAPGNHDALLPGSPYLENGWPENVHIFRTAEPERVSLPEFDVYGAGFLRAEMPAMLDGFRAADPSRLNILVLHGDAENPASPYDPVSSAALAASGLDYAALGHIHRRGERRDGGTLCAWPGCLMGRGFDECGEKGALLVSAEKGACRTEFVPCGARRYERLSVPAGDDALAAVRAALTPELEGSCCRIELTGEAAPVDLAALQAALEPQFFSLDLRDMRGMNTDNARKVPADAPTDFIKPRWQKLVMTDAGIDRRYYELCALSELKNSLRSGDIWVQGSRQFKDFEDYLVPPAKFASLKQSSALPLAVATDCDQYLHDRLTLLEAQLATVNRMAAANDLPNAIITESGLKITPLDAAVPDTAQALIDQTAMILPHVKITELLLEVDEWTGFTRHFTHLKSGDLAKDKNLLLTTILADAINLGLTKMAESCPGTTYAKLAWLQAWHTRDETYSTALAELVNAQFRHPFAEHWGDGTTSSSDGQNFRTGSKAESTGHINPKYGSSPGRTFYTHISDQYAPFHTKVVNVGVRDSTYVLDGLLYHESDLRIEEHYTDTAGFTDHVFALMHLLGFRFAPRIRDLGDTKLFIPKGDTAYDALKPMISSDRLNIKAIRAHWDEILRLATSIKQGTVTASLMLRKLGSYPRQNGLAIALRELGRIERTLFILDWLQSVELRRRVHAGLNKGEARNALARAVFFNRLGEIRDRSFEQQRYRASGLNLVTAAVVLWNTVYLERAAHALRGNGHAVDDALLQYLSPLGWEHINLTGDYLWRSSAKIGAGKFRPLRPLQPA